MRESWIGETPAGWDDILSEEQCVKWIEFLSDFLSLSKLSFHRSLWPEDEVEGLPVLIVFSDGSSVAFGAVAYIRWTLKSGKFWIRLMMSKTKIAPKDLFNIVRIELNGSILNNRIKNFILNESNLKFERVYQFVDSSTVLGYLHKECGAYKVYEAIRVAEIQSTNVFEDGGLKGWAWVKGSDNPADWCTKPGPAKDLVSGGFWKNGPAFLQLEEDQWPIKLTYRTDRLEGENVISKKGHVSVANVANPDLIGRIINKFSSWKKMCRILGWILRLGVPGGPLTAKEASRGKHLLIQYIEKDIAPELKLAESGKGRYRHLAPVLKKVYGESVHAFVTMSHLHLMERCQFYYRQITLLH